MPHLVRVFDFFIASAILVLVFPVLVCLTIVGYFDTGAPLFRQERVGRHQQPFTLIKFRTMRPGTISVASHLAPVDAITRFGRFLRRTKLDELPQLWNVLKGEMSLVGPRPCLPTQNELIEARDALGVFNYRPGITGLGQLTGIDMSTPNALAEADAKMLESLSLGGYFWYLILTATGRGGGDSAGRRPRVTRDKS